MPKIETVRFGELTYQEQDVIHLHEGLVGMPSLCHWLILDMGDDVPMKWFQSLDRGDFGFPVSQPAFFADTYDINLPESSKEALRSEEGEWLAVMIITTVHAGGTHITGNLLAPLVVNVDSRMGVQLVMEDSSLSTRQEMNYLKFGLAVDGQSEQNDQVTAPGQDSAEEMLDSSSDSGHSEDRPEVDTPETAGV